MGIFKNPGQILRMIKVFLNFKDASLYMISMIDSGKDWPLTFVSNKIITSAVYHVELDCKKREGLNSSNPVLIVKPFLKIYAVTPRFSKIHVKPFHFHKRPPLVPVFN